MAKLFSRKPKVVEEVREGEFDIRTWTPADRRQARSAILRGVGWFWDNDKKSLLLAVILVGGGVTGIYKGLGLERYQEVTMKTFEASIGVPSIDPQSGTDISGVEFVTVQKKGGGEQLVVNGKPIKGAFYDPDVLTWKEYGTASLFVWKRGSPNLGYLENIIKETK